MFWADSLLEGRKGKELINDSWTPSGMVHMGSLKGPVIHDVLFKILNEKGTDVKFIYGFDDADPIDGLPSNLQKSHSQYLGLPLFLAPSPEGKGSFGDHFGNKIKTLLDALGVKPDEIYKTSELYKNGTFNKAIKHVLDHAADVRKVYREIYKKEIAESWFPLQVICPKCGKLGTTRVTAWDGKEVSFSCEEDLVKWAKGCGFSGKTSPFNGNAKMPWKVEWAAKWWTFEVTIEGAGKDHASAGGSYDIAMKICKDVFRKDAPLKFAYEFFLSGGKKMASSKGIGLTGEDLLDVLPAEVIRFLMIKTSPNTAIEFTPQNTDSIPKLFDDYQKSAEAYFSKGDKELRRAFELSQIGEINHPPKVRFSLLSQWVQMPNMGDAIKKEGLEEWAKHARVWVEKYAPEKERFLVQEKLPGAAKKLSEKQKKFLEKISSELDKKWDPEDFQKNLYDWAKELDLSSKDAFSAIYLTLIGKDHGPKAAWLILSLEKKFVSHRFMEASK